MTAKIVNLNNIRKTHNRELKKRQAEINRVKFGLTKAEKRKTKLKTRQQEKELSGKQLFKDGPDVT
jgi:hypothetical protein